MVTSLDRLAVGPTGIWAIQSWQSAQVARLLRRTSSCPARDTTAGALPELRWEAAAITDILASGSPIPVHGLLCIPSGALPQAHRPVEGVQVATRRQLAEIIRQGSRLQPSYVEHATAGVLELLRPAV